MSSSMVASIIMKTQRYFPVILHIVLWCTLWTKDAEGYALIRRNPNSTARNMITSGDQFDTITLDRYFRNYLTGPIDDQFVFLNNDVITAYVGPKPVGFPINTGGSAFGRVRTWAMFDENTYESCFLNAIHDFGQIALFVCPIPGIYRAYAMEENRSGIPYPLANPFANDPSLSWSSKTQKAPFDLLYGKEIKYFDITTPVDRKMETLLNLTKSGNLVVTSDPVEIKKSFYCYYWMYHVQEVARVGYVKDEAISSLGINGTSYILLEVLIWVAEPGALLLDETSDDIDTIIISDYSKLVTLRFHAVGLFPCLRKAHSVIEIMAEIEFIPSSAQKNPLNRSPHWKALVKVHTDRVISTLSDISFTIASRQNAGLFGCFVGETRVFVNLRTFEFVPKGKLERDSVNLQYSRVGDLHNKGIVEKQLKHVYGHGVQYIGFDWSRLYQPSTTRTDMVIVSNPCIAQEFAFSMGGALYVAEGLLQRGPFNAIKVNLPEIKDEGSRATDSHAYRHYLRVLDVVFTPTHLVILMADGVIMLHSTSVTQKGFAKLTNLHKYNPGAFVKRRWCPRTATPKLSSMMVPIFSNDGSIVLLQLYPTEGSTRMWVKPPSSSCVSEGLGFIKKAKDQGTRVNETDIHYNEFAAVKRSNHKTGLLEKGFEPRPEPPEAPPINFEEDITFLLYNGILTGDGNDPHFPPELTNPAIYALSDDFTDFNSAVVYVLDQRKEKLKKVLGDNGINAKTTSTSVDVAEGISLYTVEFSAVEKQFIAAVKFKANEIPNEFSSQPKETPFQMIITTMTVANLPIQVKIQTDFRAADEQLETIIPFPGVILIRPKPYRVASVKSRDPKEDDELNDKLKGATTWEYTPELFTMNTAIPSYVVDFGDIFVYKSLEGRFARPVHYYSWSTINTRLRSAENPTPLVHNDSSVKFSKADRHYDAVMTEQGIISVLWRKKRRYLVQDDEVCMRVADSNPQTVAMGSVVSLEGLREIKPFFRNDNVFQRTTPDGEIIYGVYDVKPYGPFSSCPEWSHANATRHYAEPCIEQPLAKNVKPHVLPVCTPEISAPCVDPGYIPDCEDLPDKKETQACIRRNSLDCSTRYVEYFIPPKPENGSESQCVTTKETVTSCFGEYSPREELRSVNILGTSFLSYLLGSLQSLKSMHPEAPLPSVSQIREPDVCPFASFSVYNTDFDFAEVGYKTRITGKISYLGSGIPIEADLIIEYERSMGIVIDIASSVEEERDLTIIVKTIDISFEMTDFTLEQLKVTSDNLGNDQTSSGLTYEDLRARENTTVFSITLRPSIVNMRCKNSDFFKTIQFNVGCNAFSEIRLLSEASPLKRVNWSDILDASSSTGHYKWYRDVKGGEWNLTIPRAHIFNQQIKARTFRCNEKDTHCRIPYFDLFKNEIFLISYRDLFFPQFEQFLTVSSRRVSGNMVIYDLLGSKDFNLTVNKLKAGCYSNGRHWYKRLLNSTSHIGTSSWAHENIYRYYEDCFNTQGSDRERPQQLHRDPYYMFNLTNFNRFKFQRNRNQIFIFRAVIVNTEYNRFTYCRLLDTFFMVRVTGIPIPRQGLALWHYICVMIMVAAGFLLSYFSFYKFYTWKLDLGAVTASDPDPDEDDPWHAEEEEGAAVII